jgi:uncharacterized protein YukE
MDKLYKYFGLLFLSIVLLPGCQDELTKAPLDAPSNTNFYSTQDELQLAINGAYNEVFWWSITGSPAQEMLDNMTDIGFERSNGDLKSVADGSATSTTGTFENTWNKFYRAIGRVNNLLDNMSRAEANVSDDYMERIEAEARFIRAYSYMYLSEFYGDVPLILKVPTIEEANIERTAKKEVVDQINSDLDFAAQTLPESWSGSDEGRVTKGAALALKARVALYNNNFEVAAQSAQEVMNLGIYSLYEDYASMFQYEGIGNSGVILDVPYEEGVNTHNLPRRHGSRNVGAWAQSVPSQFIVDSYEATDGEPIDESSIYDPANPFQNRDPRLDASIIRPQGTWGGFIFETHRDSVETWEVNEEGNRTERMENEDATNPYASFTGYNWRKYTDPEDYPQRIDDSELNFILIRYAEVLLTYAEGRIESGNIDQSVLDAINKVRARAYGVDYTQVNDYPAISTTNQSELRRIIRRERKVEFANEGLRLFDIRRWEIAEDVMDGIFMGRPQGAYSEISNVPEINDATGHPNYGAMQDLFRNVETRSFNPERDYLWPIPQSEINVNSNITQNPGY